LSALSSATAIGLSFFVWVIDGGRTGTKGLRFLLGGNCIGGLLVMVDEVIFGVPGPFFVGVAVWVTFAIRLSSCKNPQILIPSSRPVTIKPMALLKNEGRTTAIRTGLGAGAADRRRIILGARGRRLGGGGKTTGRMPVSAGIGGVARRRADRAEGRGKGGLVRSW
jgi:hypothetical protein